MDETLILLKSLISGAYAEAFNGMKNVENGMKIGKMWENLILQICDNFFFYEQVSTVLSFQMLNFIYVFQLHSRSI